MSLSFEELNKMHSSQLIFFLIFRHTFIQFAEPCLPLCREGLLIEMLLKVFFSFSALLFNGEH